ncbi:hypothetical protein N9N03_00290 [Chlamydiia bacterium]|nr:hypothetical protein [Chlamydiia bacterium]
MVAEFIFVILVFLFNILNAKKSKKNGQKQPVSNSNQSGQWPQWFVDAVSGEQVKPVHQNTTSAERESSRHEESHSEIIPSTSQRSNMQYAETSVNQYDKRDDKSVSIYQHSVDSNEIGGDHKTIDDYDDIETLIVSKSILEHPLGLNKKSDTHWYR